MKKIGRIFIPCCLIALLAFFAVGCGDKTPPPDVGGGDVKYDKTSLFDIYEEDRPDYGFDYDSDYVRPAPPVKETRFDPEPDPAYAAGTETKRTRLEAENAVIDFVGNSDEAWENEYSDVRHTAFDFRFSNKLATRNLNTPGTTVRFNFTSDKTYTVRMHAFMSGSDKAGEAYPIKDNLAVRSAGRHGEEAVYSYADPGDLSITWEREKNAAGQTLPDDKFAHYVSVQMDVAIYAGDTSVTFEYAGKGGEANLDYIEFETSAEIGGFDTGHYSDGDKAETDVYHSRWFVSTQPTDTTNGVITVEKTIAGARRSATYVLPKYKTDGELTEGYIPPTPDSGDSYSFDFKNDKITLTAAIEYTLTIAGASGVTFAGGAKTAQVLPGASLPAVTGLPAGKSIAGWYNATSAWDATSFVMPSQNTTITPHFITTGHKRLFFASGKTKGVPGAPTDSPIVKDKFNDATSEEAKTMVKGTGGAVEEGVLFTYSGAMTVGAVFRNDSAVNQDPDPFEMEKNKTYELSFNFENRGSDKISFEIYIVGTGYDTASSTGDNHFTLTLEAGASTSINAAPEFVKFYGTDAKLKNVLMRFEVTEEMASGMQLGIAMSINPVTA